MELDNFMLEKYNPFKIEHRCVITELENDVSANRYLGDLNLFYRNIMNDKEEGYFANLYIANYNNYPIGFISINVNDNKYYIASGLLKEFRGYHLAALLLQEFSEKIFEVRPEINNLYLSINEKNFASRKTAQLVGYEQENTIRYKMKRG